MKYSEQFDNAVWVKVSGGTGVLPAVTPNYALSPRGDMTAYRVVFDIGSGSSSSDLSMLYQYGNFVPSGTNNCASVWAISNTGTTYTLTMLGPFGSRTTKTIGPSWTRIYVGDTGGSDNLLLLRLRGNESTSKYADISLFAAQSEIGSLTPTGYIPTTTAPVSVTDYTLDAGGLITLGEVPVVDAQLKWSGIAIHT